MADILQEIVANKRQEVQAAKAAVPMGELQSQLGDLPPLRNFYNAVAKPQRYALSLIAEVKRKSPSAGAIRDEAYDPAAIALQYEAGGASAISCLTDAKYFDGHLSHIARIKDRVRLPVLRKDFIVDPYQVVESRVAGADAILLIAECLTQSLLCDLMIQAIELGMTCLVELHDAESVMRMHDIMQVPHERYTLIGINNRNLREQTVDLSNTGRILSMLEERTYPVVSESGIKTADDAQRLANYGVSGLLVGETLLRSGDPSTAIAELLGGVEKPSDAH